MIRVHDGIGRVARSLRVVGVLAALALCTPAVAAGQTSLDSASLRDSATLTRLALPDTTLQSGADAHHQRKVTRQLGELEPVVEWQWGAVLATFLAMLGAIVLTLPVAVVYKLTRPATDFDPGVMHSSLILAPTIAGILIVIQGSLAMAFSLAGVVTAVRFRNSLKDTNDAVFVFVAVAIGLAAGGQALDIALAISVIFSALVLILARSPFRLTAPPQHPGHKHAAHHLTASREDPSRVEFLVVRGTHPAQGRPAIEAVLDRAAKHWWLERGKDDGEGDTGLRYAVRLRKRIRRDRFFEELDEVARSAGMVLEAAPGSRAAASTAP